MALEIEHKFLVKNNQWKIQSTHNIGYKQGYLISDAKKSIRVRTSNKKAWLNIKSATVGTSRQEYEYEIPLADGLEILNTLCQRPFIEKTRHFVPNEQHTWEIDIFEGDNKGLVVAEIELTEINEAFTLPDWVGDEVTNEIKYYNNQLCKKPFKDW